MQSFFISRTLGEKIKETAIKASSIATGQEEKQYSEKHVVLKESKLLHNRTKPVVPQITGSCGTSQGHALTSIWLLSSMGFRQTNQAERLFPLLRKETCSILELKHHSPAPRRLESLLKHTEPSSTYAKLKRITFHPFVVAELLFQVEKEDSQERLTKLFNIVLKFTVIKGF